MDLIKHIEELDESYRSKDLLNREDIATDYLTKKLDNIPNSWIAWLIWPFWCWKTTFINQVIEQNTENQSIKRLNFDAWKYPDRKDLRENFILDMAEYLNEKEKDAVIKGLKWISSSIFHAAAKDWVEYFTKFIPNIREYIFNKEKRELYVIESLLKEIFVALHMWENWKPYQSIYIVIEDIDRSGDVWVYFLQTLNYFLKNINLWEWLKVVAIATIWSHEFRWEIDSYLKCIDYIHNFPVVEYDYKPMIQHFLNEQCINDSLIDFINYVWSHFEWFTPRTLKHILRNLSSVTEELNIENIITNRQNILALIWIFTAKYTNKLNEKITYLDEWKKEWEITESVFKSFFLSTAHNDDFITKISRNESQMLDPEIYDWKNINYKLIDFWNDNRIIVYQAIYWQTNATVFINKKIFSL